MNIFLNGDHAVPMIIAKRFVKKEPKINKIRNFVGFKQGFGTLVYKTIELIQECFWNETQNVEDAGESEVIHYVIDVLDDPGSGGPELVVTKLHGKARPGCGIYCEVISPNPDAGEPETQEAYKPEPEESGARLIQPKMKRPPRPARATLPPPSRGS